VTPDEAVLIARVLKFVDRGGDVILYEPGAAAQVFEINEAADDGEQTLIDAFDPGPLGVPQELRRFYVMQYGMMSRWSAPMSADLPEIRRVAEGIGWRLEEGSMDELPQRWGDS
jgi:hypothetical protein